MLRFVHLMLLPLFVAACDGVNSSMTHGPVVPPSEKPTACKMDFTQTCWSKTVSQITSCLRKEAGSDVFSTDREFCANLTTDKLVHFQTLSDIFMGPMNKIASQLNFKVYPDSVNECFSVSGTQDKFVVHLKKTGEKVSFKFNKDEMSFNCLDGQEVSVSAAKINGCENVMGGEFQRQVPGFVFEPIVENGLERGWMFRFRGAPDSPDVFKCYYP